MGILDELLRDRDDGEETTTYRDFKIVTKPEKGGGVRGVAWIPMEQRHSGVSFFSAHALTRTEVFKDLENRANEHADAWQARINSELKATLEVRHKAYLASRKVNWHGWKKTLMLRSTSCHECGSRVRNAEMPVCGVCSGIVCLKCAACGCGWPMWEKVR
jgi:hypothetical protein